MLDNGFDIIEVIQGVEKLSGGGLYYVLPRKDSWAAKHRRGDNRIGARVLLI